MTRDLSQTISWLHFGDLHMTTEDQPNYRDFLALIEDANEHVADGIDFAVLPSWRGSSDSSGATASSVPTAVFFSIPSMDLINMGSIWAHHSEHGSPPSVRRREVNANGREW